MVRDDRGRPSADALVAAFAAKYALSQNPLPHANLPLITIGTIIVDETERKAQEIGRSGHRVMLGRP
jgi:hypothetical protein